MMEKREEGRGREAGFIDNESLLDDDTKMPDTAASRWIQQERRRVSRRLGLLHEAFEMLKLDGVGRRPRWTGRWPACVLGQVVKLPKIRSDL
jgi:hypothetical protein